MNDDVATIEEAFRELETNARHLGIGDLGARARAAYGRVVAERDEAREERDTWSDECQRMSEAHRDIKDKLRAEGDELRARLQQHEQTDSKEEANG